MFTHQVTPIKPRGGLFSNLSLSVTPAQQQQPSRDVEGLESTLKKLKLPSASGRERVPEGLRGRVSSFASYCQPTASGLAWSVCDEVVYCWEDDGSAPHTTRRLLLPETDRGAASNALVAPSGHVRTAAVHTTSVVWMFCYLFFVATR
jgi:hypothetical protein